MWFTIVRTTYQFTLTPISSLPTNTQPPVQWVLGFLPGGKATLGMVLTTNPYWVLRLKKGWSYASTSPWCLHGILHGELHHYLLPFVLYNSFSIAQCCSISLVLYNSFSIAQCCNISLVFYNSFSIAQCCNISLVLYSSFSIAQCCNISLVLYSSFSIAQCCNISLVLEFMKPNNWLW